MNRELDLDALLARFDRGPRCPARDLMGGEVVALDQERGYAQLVFDPGQEFCARNDLVHGGFQAAMLDEAMSIAAVVHSNFQQVVPTLAMKTSYLRPVRRGLITVEGEVTRMGRRVAFLTSRLFDADGKLSANATSTVRVLPMTWAHPEQEAG